MDPFASGLWQAGNEFDFRLGSGPGNPKRVVIEAPAVDTRLDTNSALRSAVTIGLVPDAFGWTDSLKMGNIAPIIRNVLANCATCLSVRPRVNVWQRAASTSTWPAMRTQLNFQLPCDLVLAPFRMITADATNQGYMFHWTWGGPSLRERQSQ